MELRDYAGMVDASPVRTVVFEYRNKAGSDPEQEDALQAAALTDVLRDGLSMVYSFFRPELDKRSVGAFMVLDHVRFAAELGSDMPFCLEGGGQLCFGRGERLEPLPLPAVPPWGVLLIKDPRISVSTPWAYDLCRQQRGAAYLSEESAYEARRRALQQAPLLQALAARDDRRLIRRHLGLQCRRQSL
jgi:hypothetical protein